MTINGQANVSTYKSREWRAFAQKNYLVNENRCSARVNLAAIKFHLAFCQESACVWCALKPFA